MISRLELKWILVTTAENGVYDFALKVLDLKEIIIIDTSFHCSNYYWLIKKLNLYQI